MKQRPRSSAAALVLLFLLLSGVPAMAQGFIEVPDTDAARVRIGPLFVKPTVALTNLGVDTNVFNDAESEAPQSDFTFSFTPQADLYLRMGRTWLVGLVMEDVVWYQDYQGQRSVNDLYSVNWLAPLTRVAFSVGGSYLDTRERPGFEIDTRAQRADAALNAAFELRMLSKTLVGVRGARKTVAFAEAQFFEGTNLEQELNRTETSAVATIRHEVTPLTSLVVDVTRQQDRFELSPDRDADTTRVDGGLRFSRFALITGSAMAGFRKFEPLSADVPSYTGLVLSTNVSYVALGSTKFGFSATRDVQYSFDELQPYYLQTGIEASIAQQIWGPVDITARFGTQRLEYEQRSLGLPAAAARSANRLDRIHSYGAGMGYRTGRDLRIGFSVENARRESDVADHQYEGIRYGVSITYGL